MDGNAVLLDFVDGAFEILFANKRQQSSRVVRPPEHVGRQDVVYFSPFGLKLADRRLQVSYLRERFFDLRSRLRGEYNRIFAGKTLGQTPVISATYGIMWRRGFPLSIEINAAL